MLDISIPPGKYVLAVSGGVDSMVLLHVAMRQPDVDVVVAHFDHGIRPDSAEDRRLVQRRAVELGLPFVYAEGQLGEGASEAVARRVRYEFLEKVQTDMGAVALVTAHHQDDLIETALINLLRGTNRRGLSALSSDSRRLRPLLTYPKSEIQAYAAQHGLVWREDSTNQDESYLRNFVRRQLVPKLTAAQRAAFIELISQIHTTNQAIDAQLAAQLAIAAQPEGLNRRLFAKLDHKTARELLAFWLRSHDLREYDTPMLERLVVAIKTARPGSLIDIMRHTRLRVGRHHVKIESYSR